MATQDAIANAWLLQPKYIHLRAMTQSQCCKMIPLSKREKDYGILQLHDCDCGPILNLEPYFLSCAHC